jgi:hypothetical protein
VEVLRRLDAVPVRQGQQVPARQVPVLCRRDPVATVQRTRVAMEPPMRVALAEAVRGQELLELAEPVGLPPLAADQLVERAVRGRPKVNSLVSSKN